MNQLPDVRLTLSSKQSSHLLSTKLLNSDTWVPALGYVCQFLAVSKV